MTEREPTADEREFFDTLAGEVRGLQDWYHVDATGRPWMMASFDVIRDGRIEATWRLDYDGRQIVGGPSPAHLNWDAEMRADAVGVDTTEPHGIRAEYGGAARRGRSCGRMVP